MTPRGIVLLWALTLVFPIEALSFQPGKKAEVAKPQTVTAWVVEVDPTGDMRPLTNARCTLITSKHRPGPHGGRKEIVGRWHALTDNAGRAQFEAVALAGMERAQMTVPFQGVAYRSEELTQLGKDIQIRVFHTRAAGVDIRMRSEWTLELSDSMIRVTQVVHLENPTRTTMDYTHAPAGFRVPTLSHALSNNRVVTYGMFPNGPLHGDVSPSTGQGRVESEDGAVVYRGPVLPGDGLFFRVAYNIPYEQETVHLAAVADVSIREAVVSVVWTHKAHPRIRLSRPHRAMKSDQGGFSRVDFMINGRLDEGTPLVIHLDHLPMASPIPRWVALAGGVGVVAVLLLLLVSAVLRRKRSSA